ncbi:zinc finger and SCAN domain-containing protein 2-like [Anguilla anguilla]|uniref:zinc finger and SCAN domain-containing protein 2-like n=1 Tax=Anguilla anguilla TaxID=7936 RepID=UPI0015B12433|nr:zinc finger and SCAN domain-containing protein 2-like [Anguilla anguilla]
MTNYAHFQRQITTIMEIMTKSAIEEITKLFDDSSSVLCFKISRSLNENEALKKKLQLLQHELRSARGQKEEIKSARESPVNTRSVGVQVFESNVDKQYREGIVGQEWSFCLRRDGEPAGVEQSANMEHIEPESVLIKQERLEEGFCYKEPTPRTEEQVVDPTRATVEQVTQSIRTTEEQVTQLTSVEDEKKPDTEPTGDPEELSEQHRCEHGDEELSGLEFVVKAEQEEEQAAQRLSQTGCERSAGRLNNLGSGYVMYGRDSQLWTYFTQEDSDLHDGDTGKKGKADGQGDFGKKPFICIYCAKSFDRCSRLISHHRIHTGEKPYSCAQCGKCFSLKGNLVKHERVHSGYKPFGCTQCGKRFTRAATLRAHHRSHTGERPHHWEEFHSPS